MLSTAWGSPPPRSGSIEQAVDAFREAIRLDPRFVPAAWKSRRIAIALNRFEEAKGRLAEASSRGLDFISLRRMAYLLAFLDNDSAAMARELDLVRRYTRCDVGIDLGGEDRRLLRTVSNGATSCFSSGVEAALRDNFQEFAAQWTMEDAETHAIADAMPRRSAARSAAGLELSRDNFTLERASRVRALLWRRPAKLQRLSGELANRFPNATLTTRIQLPVTVGRARPAAGEPARALELLETVRPYDHAPASEFWPAYLRGLAYLQSKDGRGAAAQFRSILSIAGRRRPRRSTRSRTLGLARAAVAHGRSSTRPARPMKASSPVERCRFDAPAIEKTHARRYARLQ